MDSPLNHPPPYLKNQIRKPFIENKMKREIVWTYIVGRKYENEKSHRDLAKILGVEDEKMPEESKIWLEAYLQPTRENEGDSWMTRSDLSIGCLKTIESSELQICSNGNWVCICEAKWNADVHYDKKDEVNQLAKLIEHALLIHNHDVYPERVYVTLITPQYFKDKPKNKDYQNIFSKYQDDKNLILNDLQECKLKFKDNVDYNFLTERLSQLYLNWVTFEELLGLPNLVEDHRLGKYRVTIDSWEKVLMEMGRKDLYSELSSKIGGT